MLRKVKPKESVKRIVKRNVMVKAAKKSETVKRKEILQALELPMERKKPSLDMQDYSILLYGRPKIGKTTFFASFPDVMFLTTEPGTKGQSIFEFNAEGGGVIDWHIMLRAVDLLEQEKDRFTCVVIDTVEEAYAQCLEYTCDDLGIPYPGEDRDGTKDHGASWHKVKKEFTRTIQRILHTGRAIHYTSHAKQVSTKARSGDEFNEIVPTMTGQARAVVEPLVDFIFFADYRRTGKDQTARVIVTEGDELITAGSRLEIPPLLPMLKRDGYGMLLAALAGEDVGLDANKLMPSVKSFKATQRYITRAKGGNSKIIKVRKKGG